MSQEQPPRPEPVRCGDVFHVSGELASTTVAPRDAALMQAAETAVLGQTLEDGPAAVMQSAADANVNHGGVGHDDIADIARYQGVKVTEVFVGGRSVIAEAFGGEVGGGDAVMCRPGQATPGGDAITVGEALEATAFAAGDKPVDQSDAAAIQAAEVRATGWVELMPGGIGAEAQSAANLNPGRMRDQEKTKLRDVLVDATDRLPDDKPETREDAERVAAAESRQQSTTGRGGRSRNGRLVA